MVMFIFKFASDFAQDFMDVSSVTIGGKATLKLQSEKSTVIMRPQSIEVKSLLLITT